MKCNNSSNDILEITLSINHKIKSIKKKNEFKTMLYIVVKHYYRKPKRILLEHSFIEIKYEEQYNIWTKL